MKFFLVTVLFLICSKTVFSQKTITTFTLDHNASDQVYLIGDFNNWNPRLNPMYRKNGKWHLSLELKNKHYYYSYLTKTNIIPDPDYPVIIDDKLNKFISLRLVGNEKKYVRNSGDIEFPAEFFPAIIYEENKSLSYVFNHSSELLFRYFYSFFSNSSKYEHQDSPLLAITAAYFPDVIPVDKYLNSFYEDEYQIYNNIDDAVNCAFLPYSEFRYFQITGDDSRFKVILPKLLRKYELLKEFASESIRKPIYSFHPEKINQIKYSPVFIKSIQALFIRYTALIAGILNDEKNAQTFVSKYVTISDYIIRSYIKGSDHKFQDIWLNKKRSDKFHSGMLTTVLAEVCPKYSLKSAKMSFSKSDYFYPYLNYLYCKGLNYYSNTPEAKLITEETINKIIDSFNNVIPNEEYLPVNQKFNDAYQTFWSSYSAVVNSPMLFDESLLYAQQENLLTAGPGFYNLLIEEYLGLELAGNENTIRWKIKHNSEQGFKNLSFRNQKVDLKISPQDENWILDVKCSEKFMLELSVSGRNFYKIIEPGFNSIILE